MKKIWLAFLACMSFACLTLATSCSTLATSCSALSSMFGSKLAFNECYLEEVMLGDPIMLDEYIDPYLTDDYTAILTCDETGQERDLKSMGQWTTDRPGTYTLTYTVNSGEYKGTISAKITVTVPEVEWEYSKPSLLYRAGDTMEFNYFKRVLNVLVKSYYNYTFEVKSVTVGGVTTDLTEQTSYTFKEEGEHAFTFGIDTEDGQSLSATYILNVRPQQILAEGAVEWMEENNITVDQEGYTYVSPDGRVELEAASYNGSILRDYVPYIAFNGEEGGYGSDTYVMADFTGKNLPQVAFFCKDVKSSFTDGGDGVLFYNGFGESKWNGSVHPNRLVIYGPNKVGYGHLDNMGRLIGNVGQGDPCPASWNALQDDCKYRYIVGIENATVNNMTFRILLINLTTSERVLDYTATASAWVGTAGTEYLKDNIDESYYSGSIVLYSPYGFNLKLDKVYMPITDIGDIYELDNAAEFKEGYKANYALGATANVKDYVELADGDEFRAVDPEGMEVAIDADGNFTFTKSGTYRLYYKPSNVDIRQSSIAVKVMYDLNNPFKADQLEKDGALVALTSNQISVANTKADFINEGEQSIRFYTINSSNNIDVYIPKTFANFVFLDRTVQGISFDVYSAEEITYNLRPETTDTSHAAYLKEDYTGTIPAETWTTVTLSRDLMMKNYETYKSKTYAIALSLVGKFAAQTGIYVDNVQLVIDKSEGTVATEAQTFMTENDITAHAYNSINADMSVSLKKGYYQGNPTHGASPWMSDDDVPYIAYNGDYGAGSYVVADFTGKNIPQLCFFVDEVTSSLVDGKAGIYVHTGMVYPNGENVALHDSRRITFFGPNKIEYGHIDNLGRLGQYGYNNTEGSESPFSIYMLQEGVRYRYVIGIKSVSNGTATLELLLINLDTNEKVAYLSHNVKVPAASGNIVMYGRYNVAITLDKVYPVCENVTDIYAIDQVSAVLGA